MVFKKVFFEHFRAAAYITFPKTFQNVPRGAKRCPEVPRHCFEYSSASKIVESFPKRLLILSNSKKSKKYIFKCKKELSNI